MSDAIVLRPLDSKLGAELVLDMAAIVERSMHKPDEPMQKVLNCSDEDLGEIVERFLNRDVEYRTLSATRRFRAKSGHEVMMKQENLEEIIDLIGRGRAVTLCASRSMTPRQLIEFRLLLRIACRAICHTASQLIEKSESNPSYF